MLQGDDLALITQFGQLAKSHFAVQALSAINASSTASCHTACSRGYTISCTVDNQLSEWCCQLICHLAVQSGCHKCHTYVPGCWKWGSKFSSNLQRNGQNMREQTKPVKCCLRAKLRKQLADVKIQDIGVTFVTVDSQVTDQLTASRWLSAVSDWYGFIVLR